MTNQREIRYAQAQNEAIRLSMRRDPNVIVMGEDIAGGAGRAHLGIIDAWGGPFRSTKGLIQEFGPERVRDTPLSEGAFIGTAIGAATVGLRPIVELMFIDFLGVCLDQILNNGAKLRYMLGGQVSVPVTILTRIGAGTGSAAQHSESFYSVIAHIPGLKCVAPSDAYTAKGPPCRGHPGRRPGHRLRPQAAPEQHRPGPGRRVHPPPGQGPNPAPRTRRNPRRPLAHDVRVHGGRQVLAKQGVDAEVVDLLSLSPLDVETVLGSVGKTGRIVIVDEDTPRCSVATDIAALAADRAFDLLDAPPKTVTAPHTPVPYSRPLEGLYVPNVDRVVATVSSLWSDA